MIKHDRLDGSGMRKMLLLLAEHTNIIEVEGEKDICVFHDGWSDERVAEEMGHKNAAKIRTSRARYFGRLPDKKLEANDLIERVRICESQLHFWEKQILENEVVQKNIDQALVRSVKGVQNEISKMQRELVAAQEDLEKLRPLIDDPEPTPTIKTNGHAKELN